MTKASSTGGRIAPRVALLLCGATLALIACTVVFAILNRGGFWESFRLLALVSGALVGGVVASRRPANPVGWFLVISAACFSVTVFTEGYATYGLLTDPGSLPLAEAMAWPVQWLWVPGAALLLVFLPLYFPDGQLASSNWKWVVGFAVFFSVFMAALSAFQPGDIQDTGLENPLGAEALASLPAVIDFVFLPLWLGLLFTSAASLVMRFRRSGPEQRLQIKWLAFAASAIPVWFLVSSFFERVIPVLFEIGETLVFAGAPVAIGIAILKHRLYDIDFIINRALVYGALTVCVVGIYVLTVGYLGQIFRVEDNLLISLIATGIVAMLFQPLRERLQRAVNRLMYGERDDPYAVISHLGERLEETLAPEAVLPAVVETVREALRLPYAAIALEREGNSEIVASAGEPVEKPQRLPLTYQNEPVGELLLAPRPGEEDFSAADRRLLEDLARQAGIAAHAVRLTADLQRARERLVVTREEERRRLRRDLHDGLGPMLGSLTLKLDVARDLVEQDPATVRELLGGLKEQAQGAVTDIRRLVYALRPPALDDLGLLGAIRETAAQYSTRELDISVEAPEGLPDLPAAVEVAAYRIVQEAVTNVARHAGPSRCTVRLTLDEEAGTLDVEIEDDGRGFSAGRGRGVGIASMRERAEELGGSCVVEASPEGGTRVRASLPSVGSTRGEEPSPEPEE